MNDPQEGPWLNGVEGPARDVINGTALRILALSGPGTGKSYALKRRVWRLLEQGVDPKRILVVTLTRTAAFDLRTELEGLNVPGAEEIGARTMHSYCFSLLSKAHVLEQLGKEPRILFSFEEDYLLRDLEGDFGNIHARRKHLQAFAAFWAKRPNQPAPEGSGLDPHFLTQLDFWLRWHQGMLLSELVPAALQYLQHDPHAPERSAHDHVLVDEYQDLNHGDQILIDLLAEGSNLLVVGDDDQSIYSVRWANPEGIRNFLSDDRHELLECRRCPTSVVAIANSLILNNSDRCKPVMEPQASNRPGTIHNVRFQDIGAEAKGIARFIETSVTSGVTSPGEVLVLVNDRSIGHRIREEIRSLGLEAFSFFNQQPLEKPDAQEAYLQLLLLTNPEDRVGLRAWLGHGAQDGRRKSYARVWVAAQTHGISVAEALRRIQSGTLQVPHSTALVTRWNILEERLTSLRALGEDVEQIIDATMPKDNEHLDLLREAASNCIDPWGATDSDLDGFFERLRGEIAQPEVPVDVEYVRIMSCHKSKGLTAHTVIIAGAVDGLIPRFPREDDLTIDAAEEHLREQRRLFYVALTRATDTLAISGFRNVALSQAHKQGLRIGQKNWQQRTGVTIPSRFLQELGPSLPAAIRGEDWVKGS